MLNAYFGLVVSEIDLRGGNALKFMGDRLLTIFDHNTLDNASGTAIDLAAALEIKIAMLNKARQEQ